MKSHEKVQYHYCKVSRFVVKNTPLLYTYRYINLIHWCNSANATTGRTQSPTTTDKSMLPTYIQQQQQQQQQQHREAPSYINIYKIHRSWFIPIITVEKEWWMWKIRGHCAVIFQIFTGREISVHCKRFFPLLAKNKSITHTKKTRTLVYLFYASLQIESTERGSWWFNDHPLYVNWKPRR